MATYINPNAIKDHSVTSDKLADNVIPTDASIAAMGFTKNSGTITGITMNGTSKGTTGVVNLGTVITDVSNLATKSAAIGSLSLALDSSTYKITLSGTKVDGTSFTVQNVIDLPLESVVVNGSYNNTTKKVVLTLQNGSSVEFSVADLVAGLQSEITSSNKLSADLIKDGTTNKTVTATEKSTWNGKQNAISDLDTIRANASAGAAKVSNVQSDWNATSGLAAILNKPSNATYSTKGLVSVRQHCGLNVDNGQLFTNTNGVITTGIDTDSIAYILATSIDSYDNGDYGLKAVYDNNLTCLTLTPAAANQIGGVKIGSGISVTSDGTISGFSGNYNDLSNKPDAVTESTVSGWGFTKNAAPGTLNTNNTTAQTASASEALSGAIKLHKVAKTGTYSDLIGTPVMTSDASVAAWGYTKNTGTLTGVKFNGTNATVTNGVASITATIPTEVTESTVSGWGFTKNDGTITGITMNGTSKGTSGVVNLGTVITSETSLSKGNTTGSGNAVTDIAVSGHQITLTKGSTFLTSHQSIKTINGNAMTGSGNVSINELPTVTSSDNGKVLMVVNGAWSMVTPVSIYSGSSAPDNTQGINGDIYLQV